MVQRSFRQVVPAILREQCQAIEQAYGSLLYLQLLRHCSRLTFNLCQLHVSGVDAKHLGQILRQLMENIACYRRSFQHPGMRLPSIFRDQTSNFSQAPISYCVIRLRLRQQGLLKSGWEALRTLPLLILYFGGLSYHLSKAILSHFFNINVEWTSTAKELESTSFFVGMDRIFTEHALMYLILFGLTGLMVYLGLYAPVGWTITNWPVIVPLANQMVCHFLVPIILSF